MDLFLDKNHALEFEKISMPVALSDSPESWQREVASEIYKQLPYIGDYAVNIIIERVSPERGYGFGSAEVSSKSQAPAPEQDQLPKIRIPLIIRDRQLQPLDVFMDGKKVYPLSEGRLHEHLFRTATFETSTRKPEDKGIADQLSPPARGGHQISDMMSQGENMMGKFAEKKSLREQLKEKAAGFGPSPEDLDTACSAYEKDTGKGRDTMTPAHIFHYVEKTKTAEDPMIYARKLKAEGSAVKFAGPKPSKEKDSCGDMPKMAMLDAIAHTVPESEVDSFMDSVIKDEKLKIAACKNPVFERALFKIASFKSASVEKTAEALVSAIKPNVVQLMKLADGNWKLKHANTDAFKPQESTVDADEASKLTGGGDKIQEKGPGATVTLSTNAAKKTSLESVRIEVINHFGYWKVWNAETNEELFGWAVPVIDVEMHPLPLFVFLTMDGEYSIQDEIAGQQHQESIDAFPTFHRTESGGAPQGDGVFLTPDTNSPMALGPFTIQNGAESGGDSKELHAHDVWGEEVTLIPTPGINAIQEMGDGKSYALPAEMKWHSLQGEPIMLARSPLDVDNVSAGQENKKSVNVGSTGKDEFSVEGEPVEKLAASERQFIKRADAEFLLVGMGMNPFDAREVLARAEKGEKVKVAGLLTITPLAYLHGEMVKKAHVLLGDFPYHLRRNLVKEAAALEDSETADKILSMNFINPENVAMFASYLPDLDDASSKLAEMLVACRLGLNQIPEGAVEASMRGLEQVIDGLKQLQQKQLV